LLHFCVFVVTIDQLPLLLLQWPRASLHLFAMYSCDLDGGRFLCVYQKGFAEITVYTVSMACMQSVCNFCLSFPEKIHTQSRSVLLDFSTVLMLGEKV
jgi:hypothetical protein